MKKLLFCLVCVALVACNAHKVSSPNGALTLNFQLSQGKPTYSLSCDGKDVLLPSPMGLVLTTGEDTLRNLHWSVESVTMASADTIWETVWGEERFIRDNHNEMKVALVAQEVRMNIQNKI